MVAEFWCPVTKTGCERTDCVGALCRLQEMNACPLARHYTECPRFKKECDGINCEAGLNRSRRASGR